MFKKLVSNLPFSPSLINQIGIYAGRLRKEQFLRKISLIFAFFAVIIQLLVLFNPPKSANTKQQYNQISCAENSQKYLAQCQNYFNIKKTATNLSQGNIDATKTLAKPGDTIIYTIRITNNSNSQKNTSFAYNLADLFDYGEIVDLGDANFDNSTKILRWDNLKINAKSTVERNFIIKIKSKIALTATSSNNKQSHDCIIADQTTDENSGEKISIHVACRPAKLLESQVIQQLPKANIATNLLFSGSILFIVAFLYARSRQLEKEIRLIRKKFNEEKIKK